MFKCTMSYSKVILYHTEDSRLITEKNACEIHNLKGKQLNIHAI